MTHMTIHPTHGTRGRRGMVVLDIPPLGLDRKSHR